MKVRLATVADIPRIQQLFRQLDDHHRQLRPERFELEIPQEG